MATQRTRAAGWTALCTALALQAGCSSEESGDTTSSGDPGAGGNTGTGGQGTGAGTSTSNGGAGATGGVGASGGMGGDGGTGNVPVGACDPAPEPGSLYEKSAISLDLDKVDPVYMCEYTGDVLLIVNVAAL